jgi:hypothetical protein
MAARVGHFLLWAALLVGCSHDPAKARQPDDMSSTADKEDMSPQPQSDTGAIVDVTDDAFAEPDEAEMTTPAPGPVVASTASATQRREGLYDRAKTAGNPLKGFLTSHQWTTPDQRIPHRLEFLYLPISAVIATPGGYSFETGLEPYLRESEGRGNHMVLRFFLDYPSKDPGLPDWLANQVSCTPYTDYGGGCSPDYDDPLLQSTLLDFIAAFGARYNGDRRLGFVQLGLLGFWGEWHTYPRNELFASDAFQKSVIAAFDDAFDSTPLLLRYPIFDSPMRNMGFHDDSFAFATLGDVAWYFLPKLVAAGAEDRWRQAPIGGEVYPELQKILFSGDYEVGTDGQDMLQCIRETHASWMINNGAFRVHDGYEGAQLEAAREAALAMGYEFWVPQMSLTASGLQANTLDVTFSVDIAHSGVAPFYYPLHLQLDGGAGDVWTLAEDLQTLQPGEKRTLSMEWNDVPADFLSRDFRLSLTAPILFGDQVLRFADTQDTVGVLAFSPEFGCQVDAQWFTVGEQIGECYCDVDGGLVDDAGVVCE